MSPSVPAGLGCSPPGSRILADLSKGTDRRAQRQRQRRQAEPGARWSPVVAGSAPRSARAPRRRLIRLLRTPQGRKDREVLLFIAPLAPVPQHTRTPSLSTRRSTLQKEPPRQLPGPCLGGPAPSVTSGCPEGTSGARVLAACLLKHRRRGRGGRPGQSGPLTLRILSPEHRPTNMRERGGPPPPPPLLSQADSSGGGNQAVTPVVAGPRERRATQTARRGRGAPRETSAGPRRRPGLCGSCARARGGKARPPARGAQARTERLTLRLRVGFTTQTSCPAAEKTRLAL